VPAATALSAFLALNGIALSSPSWVKLEKAFGQKGAKRLERLERHLHSLKLTVSFGRSLANLVLVVCLLYLFNQGQLRAWPTIQAALVAGAIIAFFGVALPNAWASYSGEKVLAATLEILLALRYALYPVVAVMAALDLPIRRLAGASEQPRQENQAVRDEILQAVSEGQAEGAVQPEEGQMIASVIGFADKQAGQIMTPRTDIYALPAGTPCAQAARMLAEGGHSRVPVYDDDLDNVIGILYAKDLLGLVGGGPPPTSLRSVMRKPYFVPQTKGLDDLLKEFKVRKVHLAVVLDEFGGTAGLVTIEDVVEEIVGEIADEYDVPEPALMHRVDAATADVDGRMYVDDLNEAMGLEIPPGDYTTVAGFVFSELGYIPTPGEMLIAHGAKFTVLAADERKITRLRVEFQGQIPKLSR
jgi:CBS domain containing-hemolysin-like protein